MKITKSLLASLIFLLSSTLFAETPVSGGHYLEVPLDYSSPEEGSFGLYFEVSKDFDSNKPTIFFINDGQQSHVLKNSIDSLKERYFDDSFNLVGIVGRGKKANPIGEILNKDDSINWKKAYQYLNSSQWVEDIESVRKHLLGTHKVLMYGRSGGGRLLNQYLAKYGQNVSIAFSQAGASPWLQQVLEIENDHFWDEIGEYDPELQNRLLQVVSNHPEKRKDIIYTLFRQNVYVPLDQLEEARTMLINLLYEENWEQFSLYTDKYHSGGKLNNRSAVGTVRLYESAQLTIKDKDLFDNSIHLDAEVLYYMSEPLLRLQMSGDIPLPPKMNFKALKNLETEVIIFAGRYDHVVNFRTQILLSAYYKNSLLLMMNDNHTFLNLENAGLYKETVTTLLRNGINHPETDALLLKLDPYIYKN